MKNTQPAIPATFLALWVGQLISFVGNNITEFALSLWAFEQTKQATTLALIGFFQLLPATLVIFFAGIIVDRYSRKLLIILSDSLAALLTLSLIGLYATGNLQIWHVYASVAIGGACGQIQGLAYNVSVSVLLPKAQFTRANSLLVLVNYAPQIIAYPIAGWLYPIVGLPTLLFLDLLTFLVNICITALLKIPQPACAKPAKAGNKWQELLFGYHFIWHDRGLRLTMAVMVLFVFGHDLHGQIQNALILTRGDSGAVAAVSALAGIAGVLGGVVIIVWGGPQKRIHGWLLGVIGIGFSKLVLSLGRGLSVWLPAQFFASFNFPLMISSRRSIWQVKVSPEAQGRVFAASQLGLNLAALAARVIAGPLADKVFEPATQPGGALATPLGWLLGSQAGSGMVLVMVLGATLVITSGVLGYAFSRVRTIEETPEFEARPVALKNPA